jgi:hypothetical protein
MPRQGDSATKGEPVHKHIDVRVLSGTHTEFYALYRKWAATNNPVTMEDFLRFLLKAGNAEVGVANATVGYRSFSP